MVNIHFEATTHINVSPYGFRKMACDFFKCFLDFKPLGKGSIVPFFLCCRAIELALKSLHLDCMAKANVKEMKKYSHDLVKSYKELPPGKITLSEQDLEILEKASNIYKKKDFEYFSVRDALNGFKNYPDLEALSNLARKITGYDAFIKKFHPPPSTP